jgi:hypothetical protein
MRGPNLLKAEPLNLSLPIYLAASTFMADFLIPSAFRLFVFFFSGLLACPRIIPGGFGGSGFEGLDEGK